MVGFSRLSVHELRSLAGELRSGRLMPPYSSQAFQRWMDAGLSAAVAADFAGLTSEGFSPYQIARTLEVVLEARERLEPELDRYVQIVTTGPGAIEGERRDTSAVVQAMFASARESVDIAGFAIYQGREVFRVLAERMEQLPGLRVRMFVNIARAHNDTSAASEIIKRFANRLRTQEWPQDKPLPEVYYDPRALETEGHKRASFHAKCVVVDHQGLFVTSANFTEAAHERNIEVGVLLDSHVLASRLEQFFSSLIATRTMNELRLTC